MAAASEVPGRYDVVINGQGYTFLRTLDGSYLSASRHRAEYTSTPTFLERQNVSGRYGDDSQSFFLTASQNDWAGGEQQKFFRTTDQDSIRRYWAGTNVDVRIPGVVTMRPAVRSVTFAASVLSSCDALSSVVVSTSTNTYLVAYDGTITDQGAHGVGASPGLFGMAYDGTNVFISGAGGVVRKLVGGVYSTFSASPSDALAFLNNTLYGYRAATGDLVQYDSAGTLTSLFTWKGAAGAATTGITVKLKAFGGQLLILRREASTVSELWIYDGVATKKLANFPPDFQALDMDVVFGTVCISGSLKKRIGGTTYFRPAILDYVNGTIGNLWLATDYNTSSTNVNAPAIAAFNNGLLFTDDYGSNLMFWDITEGSIETVGSYTATTANSVRLAAADSFVVHTRAQTGGFLFPNSAATATTASVSSSLIDFDNSLTKVFRGIKVDFVAATDGDGGSVDVSYQVDSLDGAYTSLATGVTSGVETLFGSTVKGRAISVKVTLNKGTSTNGPQLKRVYVRAAPVLQAYKVRTYQLDLSSTTAHPTRLEDDTDQPLNGFTQAQNLQTAIASTSPFSITDKFGTFTGVCEPAQCSILEIHSAGSNAALPGQYVATITVREV